LLASGFGYRGENLSHLAVAWKPTPGEGGSINNGSPLMAKTSISLVSVQKPTANTPILQRRNKLTSNIDQQITKIGLFREGKRISREQFWVDANGTIYFQLRYGKQPLELEKNKSTLKAATFDDLVAQLDEIKTIAVAGGLDDALSACANAVRSNFKAAKDKKSGKGS
jgi:hypothetical protein